MKNLEVLARGRIKAEELMVAQGEITRPGVKTWNPVTLQFTQTPVTVYSGKCRIRPTQQQDSGAEAADQNFVQVTYTLSLPVIGSETVKKDDTFTVTAYTPDPAMVGRRYTIGAAPAYSDGTARRFTINEAQ